MAVVRVGAAAPAASDKRWRAWPNPVGILIHAANGYVIEIITQAARPATLNAAEQFMTYHGSWGRFTADGKAATVTYQISGDLDPGRTGQRVAQSFERKGTQLVLTELAQDGRPVRRKTWERIPELEGLPEYQDPVVGFWQWTSAGMYNSAGVNVRPAYRDESVIVYTPTGHMAVVYLPPPGRKPFAGPTPTVDEARSAWQASVSYFGTYLVQPKSRQVFHYQLAAANPTAVGGSFMRNFELKGVGGYTVVPTDDARWSTGTQHADAEAAGRPQGDVARLPAVIAGSHRRPLMQRAITDCHTGGARGRDRRSPGAGTP